MQTTLNLGTFTPSLLLDIARSTGRLAHADLDIRETSVASSPAQFAALVAGELDLAMTSPDNVLAYRFLSTNPLGQTLPVQILAGIDRGIGLALCIGPDVDGIEAVRGRIVGVDVPQSGFAFVAFALLEQAGLTSGDYTIESLGSTPRRANALVEGRCAATVLNAGNELRAEAGGCRIVSQVTDLGPYVGTVIAALEAVDPEVRDQRRRFVDAVLATAGEILGGQWESEVIEAAMRLLGLGRDEARAHHACLLDPRRGLIADGLVDELSVSTLIELRRKHQPTAELDEITNSWPSIVIGRGRGESFGSSHA